MPGSTGGILSSTSAGSHLGGGTRSAARKDAFPVAAGKDMRGTSAGTAVVPVVAGTGSRNLAIHWRTCGALGDVGAAAR